MKKYIVVGAGILGASTAYHLAKKGAEVIVIDRRDEGQATDAAAGIICPWLTQRRNKAWYYLAKTGAHYYTQLIHDLEQAGETETGYSRVGALCIHSDQKKLEAMLERGRTRLVDAPEMGELELLAAEEAKSLFPPLGDGYGAVHVSGAARIDGRALRDCLLRSAKRYGATIIRGEAELVVEHRQVLGVKTQELEYRADAVIVTNGAWARPLLEPLGIDFQIGVQKGQIIHLELPNQNTGKWPVVMPPGPRYFVPFEQGRLVVGVTHEDQEGYDLRPTIGGMKDIMQSALEIAPGLHNSTFLEVRVGFRPTAPNYLPVIGELPHFAGIYVANGLGSSGLTVGPYLGLELANLVVGDKLQIQLEQYAVSDAVK